MPITERNTAFTDQAAQVEKTRAFAKGSTSAQAYVKPMPGQSTAVHNGFSEVDLFRGNAYFIEPVKMTLDAFTGMIMTPPPSIDDEQESIKPFLDDLTTGGEPLARCVARTVREVLLTGRQFALVDWPQSDPEQSKADAQAANERAYVTFYKFEDLIDFRTAMIDGERRFTQIRVYEGYNEEIDEFTQRRRTQIKVLELVPSDGDEGPRWIYQQRIFRQGEQVVPEATVGNAELIARIQSENATWRQIGEAHFPRKQNQYFDRIPCVFFGAGTLDPAQVKGAPLDALVNIAESHLQNSALREWSLMWCGATTLVLSGGLEADETADDEGEPEPIRIGSSQALQLGENGKAELLQATEDSVGAITATMKEKQEHMAAAGAMLLTNQIQSNITNETALLMRVGQFATLSDVAMTVAEGYEQIITLLVEWQGLPVPEELGLTLNTKYVPAGLKSGELNELIAGVQAGELPRSVLLDRLKEAGAIDSRMSEDEFKDKLAEERDEFGAEEEETDEPEEELEEVEE